MNKVLWARIVGAAVLLGLHAPAAWAAPVTVAIIAVNQPNANLSYGELEELAKAVNGALSSKGMTVTSETDASLKLVSKSMPACREMKCASSAARALGVDYVAIVTAWSGAKTKSGKVLSFDVTLVDVEGESAGGSSGTLGRRSFQEAAPQAVSQAYDAMRVRKFGTLTVNTTPVGAMVYVDGRPETMKTPYMKMVEPGLHHVVVYMEGYRAVRREVVVESKKEVAVEIAMSRGPSDLRGLGIQTSEMSEPGLGGGAAMSAVASGSAAASSNLERQLNATSAPEAPKKEASVWNYVAAGGLGAVGVFFAASAIRTAATNGDCVGSTDANGNCSSRVDASPSAWLMGGAAVASLAGAGAILWFMPFKVDAQVDHTQARFTLTHKF
jgi:hypothetical protein